MSTALVRLWRGEESLARAFWEYAIVYGTLANAITTIGTFAAVAADAPAWVALVIFLLPLPYNVFVVVAVWRSAVRYQGPHEWSVLARIAVIVWALIACVA
ncbi:MAG: hypothetical protein GEU91_17680 [Rhizobiales bacterium]|nr:hypothetical protein [Hyphomicrobiales bacterium]